MLLCRSLYAALQVTILVHNKFNNKLLCCYKFICVVATNVFVVDVNLQHAIALSCKGQFKDCQLK